MATQPPLRLADFDYPLPEAAIAQHPAPRGESRLLALDREGRERHRRVRDLPALLSPGDLLVVNDTRVIPARLFARRLGARPAIRGTDSAPKISLDTARKLSRLGGGGRVELLLIERTGASEWEALAGPGRRAKPGTVLELAPGLTAEVVSTAPTGRRLLRFSEPIEPHLERLGHVPLPPYIRRQDAPADRERYQTVYARRPGAVAAPTAGLHLSEELLAELAAAGIERAEITLHVGPGTFKPVTAERVANHRMESERYEIGEAAAAAIRAARARGSRVVAVGTTVVRALESAASRRGEVTADSGSTDLFITPGFRFRAVDVLLTNFHLPRSTLLLLAAAFAGRERVLAAYAEAVAAGYRFYSYGDAMLAERR